MEHRHRNKNAIQAVPQRTVRTASWTRSILSKTIRAVLLQRNLSLKEFSAKCGISFRVLGNVVYGTAEHHVDRLKIEDVLGQPVWSNPVEFERRQKLTAFFGVDILVLKHAQLRSLAENTRVPEHTSAKSKQALLRLLENHFAQAQSIPTAENTEANNA